MTVFVEVRDEDGNAEANLSDVRDVMPARWSVRWAVPEVDRTQYPMVGHIDPWGNTCFNQLQIPTLLKELRFLSQADDELRVLLTGLEALVQRYVDEPHTYLWFIGD